MSIRSNRRRDCGLRRHSCAQQDGRACIERRHINITNYSHWKIKESLRVDGEKKKKKCKRIDGARALHPADYRIQLYSGRWKPEGASSYRVGLGEAPVRPALLLTLRRLVHGPDVCDSAGTPSPGKRLKTPVTNSYGPQLGS